TGRTAVLHLRCHHHPSLPSRTPSAGSTLRAAPDVTRPRIALDDRGRQASGISEWGLVIDDWRTGHGRPGRGARSSQSSTSDPKSEPALAPDRSPTLTPDPGRTPGKAPAPMADTPPAGSLYLLDAHGMIFQMFHGVGPMSAPDGRPTNAVFGVTRALMSLYDRGADYLIAALDHKEPTFRDKLDGNYKAHRTPPPDDLIVQEPMIAQVLEAMRIPVLVAPGYEADDVIATVATEGAARGLEVFVCSSDKDLRQVLSDHVRILNLRKQEVLDAVGLKADWGVRPDQVIDFQALVGDSVDNVPGVPGCGPKTAAKWLQQYGTL